MKLDTSARVATVADVPLDLTRSELIVLEALLRNQGRILSKERLSECLYDFEQERSANSVETQVHRLRKKLAAAGLGLAIAKSIMERQGGRLWLDSNVRSGARFVMEFRGQC